MEMKNLIYNKNYNSIRSRSIIDFSLSLRAFEARAFEVKKK